MARGKVADLVEIVQEGVEEGEKCRHSLLTRWFGHGITNDIYFECYMETFLNEHLVNIVFGLTTLVTSSMALYYKQLEYQQRIQKRIRISPKIEVFLSRSAMMTYLVDMYDLAREGDVIWAQCVRCTNFSPKVRSQILKAGGRGARFEMIVNQFSPAVAEFRALFEPVMPAKMVMRRDNALSLQGLSNQEVVIAIPNIDAYVAVVIRDEALVTILRQWFIHRFQEQ